MHYIWLTDLSNCGIFKNNKPYQITMENKYNYFLVGVFILLFYLVYIIVKPVISAIFGSLLLAFTFYKLNKFMIKIFKNEKICTFLTVVLMLLLIIVPSFIVINSLAKESVNTYHKIISEDVQGLITTYLDSNKFGEYVRVIVNNALVLIISSTSDILLSIPTFSVSHTTGSPFSLNETIKYALIPL